MNKSKIIIIAEPSEIINEGLTNIINDLSRNIHIIYTNTLNEIHKFQNKYHINIIIVNPTLLLNNTNVFNKILSENGDTKLLGIIFAHFDNNLLTNMDDFIYINDNSEMIKTKIDKLLIHENNNKTNIKNTLSERETDVLKELVAGNSNKEIADKLCISTHTVITHRKNISQKTGIKSVSGLTIYAVVNKIITLDNYTK